MVCHRVCDYHHYSPEEEERLTTMITTTGEMAQGEGCHCDSMTGSTAMVTTMQDRLQERSESKRTTTSLNYIIRLTDRLRSFGTKILGFFSQCQQNRALIIALSVSKCQYANFYSLFVLLSKCPSKAIVSEKPIWPNLWPKRKDGQFQQKGWGTDFVSKS